MTVQRGDVVLVDSPFTGAEGQATGLRPNSVVNCINLFTVEQNKILRKLGTMPTGLMQQVNDCLKAALELP